MNSFKNIVTKLSDYPPSDELEVAGMDWEAAPCGQTKLSTALTRANFDALCDRLDNADPYGDTWEIVRFPHWKVGWLEVIFTKPGSVANSVAAETRVSLGEYPCLNEDLWVEYEVAG